MVIVFGLLGAIFLSIEVMITKYLGKQGVQGYMAGFTLLMVEGAIGTVCLIVYTLMGYGMHEATVQGFWIISLASVVCFTSLVLLFYSLAVGYAGLAISIFDANPAIQTIVSYYLLGQIITTG